MLHTIKRSSFPFLTFILLFTSCIKENTPPQETENIPNLRALSVNEQQIVKSSNEFAFNLLRQVNDESKEENFLIAPFSVGTAIAMTYNGAVGVTKEEIEEVLGFGGLDDAELNKAYKELQSLLLNMDKKTTFNIANSVWYTDEYTLKDGFKNLILENYDGAIEALDFRNSEHAKTTMNKWVEEKTQGKISDLIEEVMDDHVMFLINAIYFKATWTYRFDKAATKPGDFMMTDGNIVSREMMFSDKLKFLHSYDDQVQLINLPYGNQQFYMSIILPNENSELEEVIQEMTAERFANLIQQADTSGAHLYIPKFKLEYEIVLNNSLTELGMPKAFKDADFSALFVTSPSIYIDKVNHKTFIEVDEEGTEAGAATSVELTWLSANPSPRTIKVNRPFLFFIMEKSTQSVLFAGKVLDPGA